VFVASGELSEAWLEFVPNEGLEPVRHSIAPQLGALAARTLRDEQRLRFAGVEEVRAVRMLDGVPHEDEASGASHLGPLRAARHPCPRRERANQLLRP
jgi:hypothetical protein